MPLHFNNIQHIVLLQDFFPQIGGAHLFLYEVYKRWPYTVIFLTQDYSYSSGLHMQQLQFDFCDHGSIKNVRKSPRISDINLFSSKYWARMIKILKIIYELYDQGPLVLHSLRAFPEGIDALAFKIFRKRACKLITYAHGEEILVAKTSRQLRLLAKMVYKKSDLVIANSVSTKNLVKDLARDAKVTVIHPGVDVDAFNIPVEQRIKYREKWSWSDDTVILVTVARMEPRKNQTSVIRAVAKLRDEGLPLGYVIAGDGDEKDNLEKLVRNLRLHNWVKFLGRIPEQEKKLCFAAADIHIMPSIQVGQMIEGFGIVFMEAAAAGIPSIAGEIGGQSEAVQDGVTGLIVDGRNTVELEKAIRHLAINRKVRKKMGEQGRLWAYDHDWANVTRRILFEVEEACRF